MPGPERILGRPVTGGSNDFLEIGHATQRSTVGPAGSGGGQIILQSLGGRIGMRGSTGVYYRLFIQATTGSSVPGNVITYTDEYYTSVPFNGSNEGEWRERQIPITVVNENALLAFGATARVGMLSVGMDLTSASAIYQRATSSGSIPGNGYSSVPANGRNHIAAFGERNQPPNRPGAVVVTGGISNQRPTMTAPFSDPNETLIDGRSYDHLGQIYEEYRWGGQLRESRTVSATAAERNARQSSRTAWFDIPFDTPYTYYVRHIDRLGARSESRSYSGTVLSGASVDAPSSPTGRVTNPANPGNIVATYRNSAGLSANAVRFRTVASNGTPITTSGILSQTVAADANIVRSWATSELGTQPDATTRGVQVRARATNGQWSEWSDPIFFTTNAPPNIPTLYQPTSGVAVSSIPLTGVRATDPDQSFDDLTVTAEIYDADTDVLVDTYELLQEVPGGWNVFRERPTGIPYGNYEWRAKASDGYLESAWSPLWTFTYAAVPDVTITAPTGPTISTSQPVLEWTSTDQTHWRVRGWDGTRLVYDTGERTGADDVHTIESVQHWIGGERWNNGESFQWEVLVRDASTLWGSSSPLALTLEYPPIDELIIDGSAESLPGIDGTHYNRVFTTMTEYPAGDFLGYHRRRENVTGLNGAVIDGTLEILPTETNPSATGFTDYNVVSNQWYRYTVWQEIRVGNDVIPSPEVSIDLVASWHGIILHSNADPSGAYVWLRYGGPGAKWSPNRAEQLVRNDIRVRGRRAPIATVSGHRDANANGEYTFLTNDNQSAMEQLGMLYRVNDWQYRHLSQNGRPNGICYRDGRGGSRGLMYVTMNLDDTPFTQQAHIVNLDFTEYDFAPFGEVAS